MSKLKKKLISYQQPALRLLFKLFAGVCFFSGALLLYWSGSFNNLLFADRVTDQINQNINEIQAQVNNTNIRLDGVITEKVTLEEVIADLDAEINRLEASITATEIEIERLQAEIERLQVEIEAQKTILESLLVLLYQQSGVSSFELIIASDSFSDYLDEQEYLDRLKEGVSNSVGRIQELRLELEEEELRQAQLLEEEEAQKIALEAVRWEQQDLLEKTLNQENLFQQQLNQLQADQRQLEKDLEDYLASLLTTRVSLGEIEADDVIGKTGNTGWSTGPHLHLVVYKPDGNRYDPLSFIRDRSLVWPMGGSGGWVSQGFHAGHRAIDVAAPEGTPIRAIADGKMIHRGCIITNNPKYIAFTVIVDHGDYLSLYTHLQAPNNPKYAECSINRRNSYGTKSIDYSTTE